MDVRVGLWRKLSTEELMFLNCGAGEDSWGVCKEIQPVHPKGNQSWIFTGRTDVEAEAPVLWPRDVKSWLIWKDPDAGKDWRWEEKAMTEDKMVVWHHWCNGHELGQTPGDGEGHGCLVCCSPWGHEELDTTWWLNKLYEVNYMQWKLVRCCGQEQGWWKKLLQVALLFWASSACKNSYSIGCYGWKSEQISTDLWSLPSILIQ